ncbi:MAG: hypothetical protein QOD72_3461, partial [Acidimicrobiaceae bacterium]|nr:hypothetical protein [Acidimicrobiaceae bacterium]
RLHSEMADRGLTVVTVALDVDRDFARPFIDKAQPTHPSLIDVAHVCDDLFGFTNVPMAVWIDEHGMIVRPAEPAAVASSGFRDLAIPDNIPDRMKTMIHEVKQIPENSARYRAAIESWVTEGAESPFVMSAAEVVEQSRPRGADEARAAACFELGQHLWSEGHQAAAVPWWKEAHRLSPHNWTYKRQAWTFSTTAADAAAPDLVQEAQELYGTSWLDTVLAAGGGSHYYD